MQWIDITTINGALLEKAKIQAARAQAEQLENISKALWKLVEKK